MSPTAAEPTTAPRAPIALPIAAAPMADAPPIATATDGAPDVDRAAAISDFDRVGVAESIWFFLAHALAIGLAIWVGVSWTAIAVCAFAVWLRMFFITAGYHRYFAHRSYKTSRWFQFVLAFGGTTAAQKGVLWWAGYHREHHRYSDQPRDIHSPSQRGFFWSHVGWIISSKYKEPLYDRIRDFAQFPELRWLDRHYLVPPLVGLAALWAIGGAQLAVWGGLVSTVILWHATFTINSLAHVWGSRRYATNDTSRNNLFLALLTLGEGWHNNHHYYQSSTNQGFFWYEIDISYMILKALSWVGIVWDVRVPPKAVLETNRAQLAQAN